MYHGDGSYKPEDYELEKSFIELLTIENNYVDKMNTAIRAYDKAKKSDLSTFTHAKNIEDARINIEEARKQIRIYILDRLGVTSLFNNTIKGN